MKSFLSVIAFVISTSTFAQGVYIPPQVAWNHAMANAQICNYFPRSVVCNLNLQAQTSMGQALYSNVYGQYLYPGGCTYTWVQNYTPWPIVNAWANSWCQVAPY